VEEKADKFNSANWFTGLRGASLTSTAFSRHSTTEAAILDESVVLYSRVEKKGYAIIQTNLGNLNLELYCVTVHKMCDNFLTHCSSGYYNNTQCQRSIRNFTVEGDDPEGTGSGRNSIWGKAFKDDFKPQYSHSGRDRDLEEEREAELLKTSVELKKIPKPVEKKLGDSTVIRLCEGRTQI